MIIGRTLSQTLGRSGHGTGLTLALFPHLWDERTFLQARGTTELDPLRTILRLGHVADGAIDPIDPEFHQPIPGHRSACCSNQALVFETGAAEHPRLPPDPHHRPKQGPPNTERMQGDPPRLLPEDVTVTPP